MTKLADVVINADLREKVNIQSVDESKQFLEAVYKNLKIFTALFEQYNINRDYSFKKLISIGNDVTLFSFKQCDINQYMEDPVGDCIISHVADAISGRCYINDLKM